jgi:hypothetical protein
MHLRDKNPTKTCCGQAADVHVSPPWLWCMVVHGSLELEIYMEIRVDESKLKELMKQALVEVLEDRKEVINDILSVGEIGDVRDMWMFGLAEGMYPTNIEIP